MVVRGFTVFLFLALANTYLTSTMRYHGQNSIHVSIPKYDINEQLCNFKKKSYEHEPYFRDQVVHGETLFFIHEIIWCLLQNNMWTVVGIRSGNTYETIWGSATNVETMRSMDSVQSVLSA